MFWLSKHILQAILFSNVGKKHRLLQKATTLRIMEGKEQIIIHVKTIFHTTEYRLKVASQPLTLIL